MNPNTPPPSYDPNVVGYANYSEPTNNNLSNFFNRKMIIVWGIAVVLIIGFLVWLSGANSGTLQLTAASKTPNNVEVSVTLQPEDGKEKKLLLKPGETKKVKLPKGHVRIDGAADNLKAIDVVAIQGRKTTELTTPSGEQRGADQLASEALGCPIVINSVTYSYNCGADGVIRKHSRSTLGTSTHTTLFDNESFSIAEPYKNGLLGFRVNGDNKALVYIDIAANKVQPLGLPADIQSRLAGSLQIVVTHDPSNPRFILSFAHDKMYLFKDLGDNSPAELKLGEGIAPEDHKRTRSISIHNDQVIVYSGVGKDPLDGNEEDTSHLRQKLNLPGYVFQYDTTGKLTSTLKLPEGTTTDAMHKLTDNYYAATSIAGFEVYHLTGNNLGRIYGMEDVSSWTIQKDMAYIQTGGTIYQFTPGKDGLFGLHGLFSSTSITVSELFGSPSGILFTGFPNDDSTGGVKIYALTDQPVNSTNNQASSNIQGEPTYVGFEALIDVGVTAEQTDSLKIALGKYITSTKKSVSRVTVTNVGEAVHSKTSDVDTVSFNVKLNDELFDAKMDYSGRKIVRLYLSEPFGAQKQLFDSGNVGP